MQRPCNEREFCTIIVYYFYNQIKNLYSNIYLILSEAPRTQVNAPILGTQTESRWDKRVRSCRGCPPAAICDRFPRGTGQLMVCCLASLEAIFFFFTL